MSYFISSQTRLVFRHSLLRWWGREGLPDLQSPLNLYANCSVLLRSWKETKAGQDFYVCFSRSVNTLETFKVRPTLDRMVKFLYPGWQTFQLSPTLGARIKKLTDSEEVIITFSLGSFQDQSYKTFSWMDVKSHDLIHLNCIQFISTLIYIHKLKGSWRCMWGKGAPINILLTSELLWGKRQKAKVWWMHTHWVERLAHNSEMMHFSFHPINHLCIWKEIWFFFIYYSCFVVRLNCIYPECWSNMERKGKEGWGLALALKKLSIVFRTWGEKDPLTWTTGITLPGSTQKTLVLFTGRGTCELGGPESASGKRGLR